MSVQCTEKFQIIKTTTGNEQEAQDRSVHKMSKLAEDDDCNGILKAGLHELVKRPFWNEHRMNV